MTSLSQRHRPSQSDLVSVKNSTVVLPEEVEDTLPKEEKSKEEKVDKYDAEDLSASPSSSPTAPPTATHTESPTIVPTSPIRVDQVAKISYMVAIPSDAERSDYVGDLEQSMELLALAIAEDFELISVAVPTSINGVIATHCPEYVATIDRCEDVSASIGFFVENQNGGDQQAKDYETMLNFAVTEQELQNSLNIVNPESLAWIVSRTNEQPASINRNLPPPLQDDFEDLTLGAIIGMVCGGLAVLLLLMAVFARKGRAKVGKDVDVEEGRIASEETSSSALQNSSNGIQASPFDYDYDQRDKNEMQAASSISSKYDQSSSSQSGSSVWTYHASPSTLDPDSVGDYTPNHLTAAGRNMWTDELDGDCSEKEFSQHFLASDLDGAIYRGDWSAVGVTAALLASSSYDASSIASSTRTPVLTQTIDPSRAAELDRLVEIEDWEAVMQAAASYDAHQSPRSRYGIAGSQSGKGSPALGSFDSGSVSDADNILSFKESSGSTCGDSIGRFTATTTLSEAHSRQKRVDEMKAEIERLVHEVVPEEIENMDEMIGQFEGKEDELLETLLTIKERFVAQKARLLGHRTAQREARSTVAAKMSPPTLSYQYVSTTEQVNTPSSHDEIIDIDKQQDAAATAAAEWAIAQSLSNMLKSDVEEI